jgi:hypothetical protein
MEQVLNQMELMAHKINELQEEIQTSRKEHRKTQNELDKVKAQTSSKVVITPKKKITPLRKKAQQMSTSSDDSSSSSAEESDDDPEASDLYMSRGLKLDPKQKMLSPKLKDFNTEDYTYKHLSLGGYKRKQKIITIATEKHLELQWKDLSLDGFLSFLEEVEEFQIKHRMEVAELFPLIHKSMKELVSQQLMVNFSSFYVRRRDVQTATVDHITQAMQMYFTPNDINHFNALLKSSCYNYKVEQKSANFMPVKGALTGLRAKFMERYHFLKEACERKGKKGE